MTEASRSNRAPVALLLFFLGSGCSALIYEVIWYELLRQVVGASSISMAIVLTSFMGGLFLGSWGFSRLIMPRYHPLLIYAVLELGIGLFGLLILVLLPSVRLLYVSVVGYGTAGILLRAVVCLICLLPPTIMMGATLPAVARWMSASRIGISRLGFLYMANTLGAVGGTLLAGFYLLPTYDMVTATQFAATVNILVAVFAIVLAWRTLPFPVPQTLTADTGGLQPLVIELPKFIVYGAIAVSGLTALGAQVVWTRLMSLMLGATVYTFTIILAVFLTGLAVGSSIGSYFVRVNSRPALLFGWSQLALAGAVPLAAFAISQILPFWILDPISLQDPGAKFGHDLIRTGAAILPATILWGASFPLALASAAEHTDEPGRLVGSIYASNTLGAIVGALAFSLVIIPWLGTQQAQQALTLLAGISGITILIAASSRLGRISYYPATAILVSLVAFVALMVTLVSPTESRLIGFGHELYKWAWENRFDYVDEGRVSSVAVSRLPNGYRYFHVGGKIVASSEPVDMRLQRMLAHLPALLHPDPKSVLIVGFGAGVTAGSFVRYPGIERIVICEIEPRVTETAGLYFANENYDVLNDPRVEVIYDDARHFIATTEETFDIITSDPIHPWVKGSAALYSTEYFELIRSHLNSGGLVTQWVPLYQSSEEAVKSEIATFVETFPHASLWHSNILEEGYDLVLLGQNGALEIDVLALRNRLDELELVESSLRQVGFDSLAHFLSTYTSQASDLSPWLRDAQINRDGSLRLQYLAGLAANKYNEEIIFNHLIPFRFYPQNIFLLPPQQEYDLRRVFEGERIDLEN